MMKRMLSVIGVLILVAFSVWPQIPEGYYDEAEGKSRATNRPIITVFSSITSLRIRNREISYGICIPIYPAAHRLTPIPTCSGAAAGTRKREIVTTGNMCCPRVGSGKPIP